jgi:hypothetical protein
MNLPRASAIIAGISISVRLTRIPQLGPTESAMYNLSAAKSTGFTQKEFNSFKKFKSFKTF